jgi:hypothetical protein
MDVGKIEIVRMDDGEYKPVYVKTPLERGILDAFKYEWLQEEDDFGDTELVPWWDANELMVAAVCIHCGYKFVNQPIDEENSERVFSFWDDVFDDGEWKHVKRYIMSVPAIPSDVAVLAAWARLVECDIEKYKFYKALLITLNQCEKRFLDSLEANPSWYREYVPDELIEIG